MSRTFRAESWSGAELSEAVELLARREGVEPRSSFRRPPASNAAPAWDRHVQALAEDAGLWAESVAVRYDEVESTLRASAPALLRVPGDEPRFLAVTGAGARDLTVLAPDRRTRRVPIDDVCRALCAPAEAPLVAATERVIAAAGLAPDTRTRGALLGRQLGGARLDGLWLLHLPASAPFVRQLRRRGVIGHLSVLLSAHAAQSALWVLSWYLVGLATLRGRFDGGWLLAWALMLATVIPLRLLALHRQGLVAVQAGALLKRRLLAGTLRLSSDEVRAEGTGQFLGRVLESDAVETQATTGGLQGLVAGVELVIAAVVLALGAGGAWQVTLLVAWAALTTALAARYYRRHRAWTAARLDLTHALVEQMVGHRTRLAQRAAADRHAGEDARTEQYLETSRRLDRAAVALVTVVPRSWLVATVALLSHAFVRGTSPSALAVALGGTLLAYEALRRLSGGLVAVTGAAVAWTQVTRLFHAAADVEAPPAADAATGATSPRETLLEARGLTFGYAERGRTILRDARLRIRAGDRLLLEGPSGGGKSTLTALLAGLRRPQAGLLLLRGLDLRTLGAEAWRRRVASAPQFHDNHMLTGTLAFNLLLGRAWPPAPSDLAEAESLCRDLGLGPLLDRMPAGLHQMVGETGWQLSHGERSRVFLARALLQGAELVVVDESFGALDPETMGRALRCVVERAPTLLVVAHP